MPGQQTECFVLFHISTVLETSRHPVEVDAKAPCKVDQQLSFTFATEPFHHLLLIASRLFRGTLLHVEVGGIDDTFSSSP